MQLQTIIVTLAGASSAMASAIPELAGRQSPLCTQGTPQCCATNILDLADLDCANPPKSPKNVEDFTKICSSIGQQAQCCLLPVLEQGVICSAPV